MTFDLCGRHAFLSAQSRDGDGGSAGLTSKQTELLAFLRKCGDETPSFQEMAWAVDLKSKSGVHRLMEALIDRGYVERLPGRARSVRILDEPKPLKPLAQQTSANLAAELRRRGWHVDHPQRALYQHVAESLSTPHAQRSAQ